jgi:exonuclease VII large subunit
MPSFSEKIRAIQQEKQKQAEAWKAKYQQEEAERKARLKQQELDTRKAKLEAERQAQERYNSLIKQSGILTLFTDLQANIKKDNKVRKADLFQTFSGFKLIWGDKYNLKKADSKHEAYTDYTLVWERGTVDWREEYDEINVSIDPTSKTPIIINEECIELDKLYDRSYIEDKIVKCFKNPHHVSRLKSIEDHEYDYHPPNW